MAQAPDKSFPALNLPQPLTSFIGRDVELAEIRRLLQERRFVTLTGPGGSGKTRLAIESAAVLGSGFPDGIYLVELAPLSRPELVVETAAHVLGVTEVQGMKDPRPLIEAITGFLRRRRSLLLLDNCEHLLGECARLCDTLLSACPNLRVLATSREPLGIAGESLFRVPLLSLPCLDPLPDPSTLHGFESVRLFLDRARLADARFDLVDGNAAAVAQVCVQLDGIPLAIELAAATLRALPLSELAIRLDRRFRLLSAGDRAALPRHRTLGALLDWSHTLLDTRQQTVFRRLGVFPGEWTVDAAEAVCAEDGTEPGRSGAVPPDEVLGILMQLVDKSLVQLEQATGRYRMLETVRLYALAKLRAAEDEENARRRHFAWYLDFVEQGARQLGSPTQHAWFLRLEAEQANLRSALTWAIGSGYIEETARLALAVWKFWAAHAYHREALRWIEQILTIDASPPLPASLRARLLGILGTFAHTMNEFEQSSLYHNEALRIWREQGNTRGIAAALHYLGWQQFEAMDLEGARRYVEESLRLARKAGDPAVVADALHLFALASIEAGRLDCVVPALEESLSTWRNQGALPEVSLGLVTLARVEQRVGNRERAGQLMMEALRLQADLDDYAGMIGCLVLMFHFAFDDGKPPPGGAPPGFQRVSYLDDGKLPQGPTTAVRVLGAMAAWQEKVIGKNPGQWYAFVVPVQDKLKAEMEGGDFAREFAAGKAMTIGDIVALAEEVARPATTHFAHRDGTQQVSPSPSQIASTPGRYPAGLTGREAEVLKLVAAGLTNAQAAERLTVTPRTINAHLTSIYSKIGVTSRTAAVRYAVDHGLA